MRIFHPLLRWLQPAEPFTHWLVNRDLRVAYRPIPKNANSFLKAAFLLNHPLAQDYDPSRETALRYLGRSNQADFFAKSRELGSGNLSRIAVLRCPARRFVSAYCDKILKPLKSGANNAAVRHELCGQVSKFLGKTVSPDNLVFSDFVACMLSIPDSMRDRHYRSQSSFVAGVGVDRYFTVEKLDRAIQYLCEAGFDPDSITSARSGVRGITKKTDYRPDSAVHIPYLGDVEASQIRNYLPSMKLPGLDQLFSKTVLEQFLEGYASDVSLYCEAQGLNSIAYRDGLFGSLRDACPSGSCTASPAQGDDA